MWHKNKYDVITGKRDDFCRVNYHALTRKIVALLFSNLMKKYFFFSSPKHDFFHFCCIYKVFPFVTENIIDLLVHILKHNSFYLFLTLHTFKVI